MCPGFWQHDLGVPLRCLLYRKGRLLKFILWGSKGSSGSDDSEQGGTLLWIKHNTELGVPKICARCPACLDMNTIMNGPKPWTDNALNEMMKTLGPTTAGFV